MLFYPDERLAVFIDGANLHGTAKALGIDIDYRRLLELFSAKGKLVRALYYTAIMEDQDYSPLRPLIDWLSYNGYSVVTKPAKEYTDQNGQRHVKGNMDVELAVDMMDLAPQVEHIILMSGDGDFRRVVEVTQRQGVRVSVISSLKTQPPFLSDELRRQADNFVELADLLPVLARPENGTHAI